MSADIVLVVVVLTALAFDFTNGFHDTANVVATSISTRAMAPRPAIALASVLNFVGAFISLKVADTVGQGFVDVHVVTTTVVFAALVGAIAWNLVTWYVGLPSSSSHAMIGGLVGAVIAATGWASGQRRRACHQADRAGDRRAAGRLRSGVLSVVLIYRILRAPPGNGRAQVQGRPDRLQLATGTLARDQRRAEDHGHHHTGVGSAGKISSHHFHVPLWVVVAAARAISLGTFSGGWRIIKTLGLTTRASTRPGIRSPDRRRGGDFGGVTRGYPLSTTHVISGGITGAGAGKRSLPWTGGWRCEIVIAWCLTLPCAALVAALVYGVLNAFGKGDAGPLTVSAVMVLVFLVVFAVNRRTAGKVRSGGDQ